MKHKLHIGPWQRSHSCNLSSFTQFCGRLVPRCTQALSFATAQIGRWYLVEALPKTNHTAVDWQSLQEKQHTGSGNTPHCSGNRPCTKVQSSLPMPCLWEILHHAFYIPTASWLYKQQPKLQSSASRFTGWMMCMARISHRRFCNDFESMNALETSII